MCVIFLFVVERIEKIFNFKGIVFMFIKKMDFSY